MNILYGVVGEGMGHAIRSMVIIKHLLKKGHSVEIMASGNAYTYLKNKFKDVNKIHGLHLVTKNNELKYAQTIFSNVIKGLAGLPRNIAAYFQLIDDFHPDLVISDFESWVYYYAKIHNIPVYSVDNMQVIDRCRHSEDLLQGKRGEFELARAVVKAKLPYCQQYLITSFFTAEVKKKKTRLFPPILRNEILSLTPTVGDHYLVYKLEPDLFPINIDIRPYGIAGVPFKEEGFLDDLASCKGVIAPAGFTLLGEALFLKKPVLAIPIERQFEQYLNSKYLEKLGYGLLALDSANFYPILEEFIIRHEEFKDNLQGFKHDHNEGLLTVIDSIVR